MSTAAGSMPVTEYLIYTREYNIEKVLINDQVKEEPCFTIPEFYIVLREDLMKNEQKEGDFIPTSYLGQEQ